MEISLLVCLRTIHETSILNHSCSRNSAHTTRQMKKKDRNAENCQTSTDIAVMNTFPEFFGKCCLIKQLDSKLGSYDQKSHRTLIVTSNPIFNQYRFCHPKQSELVQP